MSRRRSKAKAADDDELFVPAPEPKKSRSFEFTPLGAEYLTSGVLPEPAKKDAAAFDQLTAKQKEKLRVAAVRAVLLRSLASAHTIKSSDVKKSIPTGGEFGDCDLNNKFLLKLADDDLQRVFGLRLAPSYKTLTEADADAGIYDIAIEPTRAVLLRATEIIGEEDARDAAAMLPDAYTAAVAGLRDACLCIILASDKQVLPERALFRYLIDLGLPSGDDGPDDAADGGDHLLANWKDILKTLVDEEFLERTPPTTSASVDAVAAAAHADDLSNWQYRIGRRARSVIGIPNLVTVVNTAVGMPLPEPASLVKFVQSLGSEGAGVGDMIKAVAAKERKRKDGDDVE